MNGLYTTYRIAKFHNENNKKFYKEGYLFYIYKNENIKDKIYIQLDYKNGISIWNHFYHLNKKPIKIISNLEEYTISLGHISAYENTFILLRDEPFENIHIFQCNSNKEVFEWINKIKIIQLKKQQEKDDLKILKKANCTTLENISICVIV